MQSSVPRTWVVAKVIIVSPDQKILAIRRSHTAPHQPLRWDLPGGLVEYGEDPVAGTIRETREETGQAITGLTPVYVTSSQLQDAYEIWLFFRAAAASDQVTLSYEHDQFKWVTPAQFAGLDAAKEYQDAVARLQ